MKLDSSSCGSHFARKAGARVNHRYRDCGGWLHWVACLLLLLVSTGLQGCGGVEANLPPIPDVDSTSFLPGVREQLQLTITEARENPTDANAVGRLGMSLHAHEQYTNAEIAYLRASMLDPKQVDWAYYRALVLTSMGNAGEALASVNRALQLDPNLLAARHLKVDLLIGGSAWNEARKILSQLLEKHPDDARALYQMGRVYLGVDDLDLAVDSLERACEYFPSYGAAHYALAGVYRRMGDRNQANRHLRAYELYQGIEAPLDDPLWDRVAELNMSPQAHIRRAIQLESTGALAEAAVANEKALEQDPALVQAHVNLVSLFGRIGQTAKAAEHFRAGLKLNPNRDDLYYNHGVLLFGENKPRDAKIAFERALAINPYHGGAQTNIGFILQTEGRVKESVAMLEKAVQNAPNSRHAHFHLARGMIHLQRVREAIPHLEKTVTPEDEQTPTFLYALSAAHARIRNKPEALAYAYRARELATKHGQHELLVSLNRDIRRIEAMNQ